MPDLRLFIPSSPRYQRSAHVNVSSLPKTTRIARLPFIVMFLLPVFVIFLPGAAPIAEVQSPEGECFDLVQGRIAWNYEGTKNWSPTNIQNLCRGTSFPRQPGNCFRRAMHGGISWGGGTKWKWENAIALCAGTNDADATISCFQSKIGDGLGWSEAIQACNETRCADLVQQRIAWNYEGNRSWASNNVQTLCRGASNATQPPRCFQRAMHGGINWGGGTRWQWENAIALCAGSKDARNTISCFQGKIAGGVGWSEAIRACKA